MGERGSMWPSGARRPKLENVLLTVAEFVRHPDADAGHAGSALDLRGDRSAEVAAHHPGDGLGIEAFQLGLHAVDLDLQRVAGDDQSAGHVHRAADLLERLGHARCQGVQFVGVVGVAVKLDHDGLRVAGEVADHVLHGVCLISTSRPGTDELTLSRTSSMISSMPRRGGGLSRTKKSPSLASVTPPPSCSPVRRE